MADELAVISYADMYAPGDITILAWLASDNNTSRRMFCSAAVGSNNVDNDFLLEHNNADLRFLLSNIAAGVFIAIQAGITSDGSWQHVTARVSGTTMNAYIDGSKGANVTFSGTQTDNGANMKIGRHATLTSFDFDGDIYYVMIVGVALSDTVISALSRGVNPFAIWGTIQRAFFPINGNLSPEQNWIAGGNTGTVTGTTKSSNPPMELLENYL